MAQRTMREIPLHEQIRMLSGADVLEVLSEERLEELAKGALTSSSSKEKPSLHLNKPTASSSSSKRGGCRFTSWLLTEISKL